MTEEIMESLNRMQKTIFNAWRNPNIPKRNFDLACKYFIEANDTVIEELSPHKIMRLTFNAREKKKDE